MWNWCCFINLPRAEWASSWKQRGVNKKGSCNRSGISQRLSSVGFIWDNVAWNLSRFFGLVAVKTARNNVLRSFSITGYVKSTDEACRLCSTSVMTSLWDALRSWVMFTCGHWFFPFLMWRMILSSGPLLSMELNGINFFSPFVLFDLSFFTFVAIHVFVLPFYLIAP